ncbi:acyl-CoA transferase [Paracoccus methylovorus]|uniref:Acyl-CoA transferase n=1 Tax=Paracoccus methylovorus TaxID=2812658 RepID=A0ABX7JNM3_9RHOB|nr:acyl-CoA transferase [Paracoccus methylovorus]QRZ15560.1 acyl-CoA transferase [Paracoccus methylovorus]
MTTRREQVLSSLFTLLQGIGGGTIVLRNEVLPERIPAAGLLILRDGTPGEAEVTLSPLRYHWQHRAEVDVFIRGSSGLELAFDALAERVGQVIAADRTLGGLCDWIETDAPEPADLAVEGAPSIKAAVLILTLHYTSNDPLG